MSVLLTEPGDMDKITPFTTLVASGNTDGFKEAYENLREANNVEMSLLIPYPILRTFTLVQHQLPRFLHMAVENGDMPLVKFLVTQIHPIEKLIKRRQFLSQPPALGSLYSDPVTGEMAVHVAARKGHTQMLVILNSPSLYFTDEALSSYGVPFSISQLVDEYHESPHGKFSWNTSGLYSVESSSTVTLKQPVSSRIIGFLKGGQVIRSLVSFIYESAGRVRGNRAVVYNTEQNPHIDLFSYFTFVRKPSDPEPICFYKMKENSLRLDQVLREMTPLHLAAKYGHPDAVKKLLELGAQRVVADDPEDGEILPFHSAVKSGSIKSLEILFPQKSLFPEEDDQEKALTKAGHLACKYGQVDVLKFLAKRGLDLTLSSRGITLVSTAVLHGQLEILDYLIEQEVPVQGTIDDDEVRTYCRAHPLLGAAALRGHHAVRNRLTRVLDIEPEVFESIMSAVALRNGKSLASAPAEEKSE